MAVKIQLRRGTAAEWTSANPTLSAGEAGVETDTGKLKVGNGVDAWEDLDYLAGEGGGGVSDHGALTGLADDDHTQYHNNARADTWLATKSTSNVAEGSNQYHTTARAKAAAVVDSLAGSQTDQAPSVASTKTALDAKAALSHSHSITEVSLLEGVLNGIVAEIDALQLAPPSHATSHKSGGGDAIKLDELAAPTDVTTLNATSSAHGLLKKLSNSATDILNGVGNWVAGVWLNVVQAWTKQQYFGTATLTDGANIDWNLDDGQVAKVTLGGNRTLNAPTNMKDGGTYILRVIQDGTGGRTLSFNAAYKFPLGVDPVLSTGANDVDVISFHSDGASMFGVFAGDFS